MATIRATCIDCGDVEMTSDDVSVRVCIDTGRGSYTFRCPRCSMAVAKLAEPRIVELGAHVVSFGSFRQSCAVVPTPHIGRTP